MAILSRFPLEDVELLSLDASTHLALLARVNVDGTKVSMLSLHPQTPADHPGIVSFMWQNALR